MWWREDGLCEEVPADGTYGPNMAQLTKCVTGFITSQYDHINLHDEIQPVSSKSKQLHLQDRKVSYMLR